MKFIGERKRDLEEADPDRKQSAHSRGHNHENIFNAIQEDDDESRYGDALPAAKLRLPHQDPHSSALASRPDLHVHRARSTSRSRLSRRGHPSADHDRPPGASAHERNRPGPVSSEEGLARGASGREDALPPIRGREAVSGKSKATSSKSRKRRTLEPNGFERWFKKHRSTHV